MCRDYQKQRVYDWQWSHIPEGGKVQFNQAQAIVDHIWEAERLSFPPKVVPFHPNETKRAGSATRLQIELQPEVTLRTIIHELAHSMSTEIDRSEEVVPHGAWFMGLYLKLIEKYLGVPMPVMLYTCSKDRVDVDINAYPLFLDD